MNLLENSQVNSKVLTRTLQALHKGHPISNRDLNISIDKLSELIDTLKDLEKPEYRLFISDLRHDLDTLESIKFHRSF
jgi:hypothetical protein